MQSLVIFSVTRMSETLRMIRSPEQSLKPRNRRACSFSASLFSPLSTSMGPSVLAAKEKELGNAAHKAEDFKTAAKHYRQASSLDPSSAVYLSNLSASLLELGDYAGAIEAIRRAHGLLKDDEAALRAKTTARLARALFFAKDYEAALDVLDGGLKVTAETDQLRKAVERHRAYARSPRAEALKTMLSQPKMRPSLGPVLE